MGEVHTEPSLAAGVKEEKASWRKCFLRQEWKTKQNEQAREEHEKVLQGEGTVWANVWRYYVPILEPQTVSQLSAWHHSHSETCHTHPHKGAAMFLGHTSPLVWVHWAWVTWHKMGPGTPTPTPRDFNLRPKRGWNCKMTNPRIVTNQVSSSKIWWFSNTMFLLSRDGSVVPPLEPGGVFFTKLMHRLWQKQLPRFC